MDDVAFENWLLRGGRSSTTVLRHRINLLVLKRQIGEWNQESVDKYILKLLNEGKSHATLNSYIDTIRLYSRFTNLASGLQNTSHFKKEYKIKGTLSDAEIETLFTLGCPENCEKKSWYLDNLFYMAVALTGCRPSEIATLKKEQLTHDTIQINKTKTSRPRLIPLVEPLKTAILNHIDSLNGEYLFVTKRGNVYSDHNWLHSFDRRMKIMGINRPNITLYSLRHSMATQLYRKKTGSKVISKLLGNSVEMVENTYSHMVLDDVREALMHHTIISRYQSRETKMDVIRDILTQIKTIDSEIYYFLLKQVAEFKAD